MKDDKDLEALISDKTVKGDFTADDWWFTQTGFRSSLCSSKCPEGESRWQRDQLETFEIIQARDEGGGQVARL